MLQNSGTISLKVIQENIRNCQSCELYKSMPFQPVCGVGPSHASICVVGEAPGEDESIIEEPFVGHCGRLLDRLLIESGLDRNRLFICNTVNCRPTIGKKNRPPSKSEIESCKHWAFEQIEIVKPKLVFTLGKISTYSILKLKSTIKLHDMIGLEYKADINGHICTVIPNLHPSYLLQYGAKKVDQARDIFKKGLSYV